MSGLKCAVVGLGLGRYFLAALEQNEDVGEVVVCDPDAERTTRALEDSSKAQTSYHDLAKMLESGPPDLVCLVTPDHMHLPHAKVCFAAGCHVLQTKPLATNLRDARAIVNASKSARRKLMVAHERRFRPSVLAIKAAIDAGDIGDLIHLRIDAISDKRKQFQRAPWYAQSESGRSALNGTGIHEVDLTRHIVGKEIQSVAGFSNRLGELNFPKGKTTSAQFLFDGDIVGQVTVTYEGRWPAGKFIDDHLRILGTKGSVFGNMIYTEGQRDWKEIPVGKNEIFTGIKGCVDAFVDSVASNAPIAVTGKDAFTTLAAAVAADKSAATAQIQTLEPL